MAYVGGDRPNILDAARQAYEAGLVVLPTRADGTKAPDVPAWREFKTRRPTPDEMRAMGFDGAEGLGLVATAGVEAWDFDDPDTFDRFLAAAEDSGLGPVVARIRAGYEDESPRGGRRWIVRYPDGVPWRDETLAARARSDGKFDTLIELPTHAILAPSSGRVHPSGRPYVRLSGGFDTIAAYTAEEREALLTVARRFDERPRRPYAPRAAQTTTVDGERPGDVFNARATWRDVLAPHGWRVWRTQGDATYWTRPGKDRGCSATTNHAGSDLLWVFSSSTAFEADRSYDKFGAYAVLNHGGDLGVAARALATRGYGHRPVLAVEATTPSRDLSVIERLPDFLVRVRQMAAPVMLVEGLFPGEGITLWHGHPRTLKTWAALDVAVGIASGTKVLGALPTRCAAVLYITNEDSAWRVAERIELLLRGRGLKAGPDRLGLAVRKNMSFDDAVWQERVIDIVRREPYAAVLVDPLRSVSGCVDQGPHDLRPLTHFLRRLQEETGAAIGLAHHDVKPTPGKADDRRRPHRASGGRPV